MIGHTSPVEHGALLILALAAVSGYAWAWFNTSRASSWRLASWGGGVVTLIVSVAPSMEAWSERSFAGHMVQHLLMIVVAAPLLVLASPVRTLRALPFASHRFTSTERAAGRWWRSNGSLVSAALFIGVLYITHLTAIYDEAIGNRLVHDIEHIAYLTTAIALWSALRSTGRQAAPMRIGSVFAVIAGSALLGVVLLSASSPLIPTYVDRLGADAALTDQRTAASLMWVGGMATTLPLLLATVWRWASAEQRIATRAEALADSST